ncbi:bifunctional helix-turn-helix transcriptional regulator/GNAT family N-acetyltransferase [Thermomonas brevis]|uniref:Bifunctional helix-turn-helix transcriptional regulator/GNAT family N-acetyltransferase n=1 Tax=Thermomonas brevis TaxID=215691 RepID=A0A7G9QWZ8_9GAMM|nr:bifunctional helix-turn-helix transcriptional regulator/GNAT family N-acetyltransferase [Thermomonas brevis]QNN47873.1 bifunctional helix-turn-helix transcriptional regulator/GNAT family N-acetyltransferase [Thermomonas brevis]
MQFLFDQGVLALGSRFKALSDRCYDAVDQLYRDAGIALQARWFPILRLLQAAGPMPVTAIADAVGQTHSAVSQLASRLEKDGWLRSEADPADRRRRTLALGARAEAELRVAQPLWDALEETLERRLAAQGTGLLHALASFEEDLAANPLAGEVLARLRERQGAAVRIVPFSPELRAHFYRLNAEWLSRHYSIEPIDHAVLSEPEQHVLAPGGAIFFALLDGEPVGTCALLQEAPGVYELSKMAVTERCRGLGTGRKLLDAAIADFRARGGQRLFLESHSALRPALRLYESAGFELQPGLKPGSHYQRSDVYMIYRGSRRPLMPSPAA